MRHLIAILALAALLAGCSPDYNWRQAQLADGAVTAFFPDRPSTQSRQVSYAGHDIMFTLTSASVGDALFTVAYASFPPIMARDAALRAGFAEGVIESLYRNLGVAPPLERLAYGVPFTIDGKAPSGKPLRLQATLWLTEGAVVEALVTSGTSAFPQAQADEFLRGIDMAR